VRGAARRALLFVPSLVLGVLGGVWALLRPWPYTVHTGPAGQLLAGVLSAALLLGIAWLLERSVPSFRYASRLMENALRAVSLPTWTTFLLAAATAGAEELFFRGALLPLVGVVPQALVFGLFHPVPRRAWAYPAFAAFAGLAFGGLTLVTGSLVPAMVAHFAVNLQGLWEVRRPGAAPRRTGSDGGAAAPFAGPGDDTGNTRAPAETAARNIAEQTAPEEPAGDERGAEGPDDRAGPP